MSDLPPMPDPTDPGMSSPQVQLISQLSKTSPVLALLAMLTIGGGSGTLASLFIAPAIDDALEKHVDDAYAHPELVRRLDKMEDRVASMEGKLENQGETLKETNRGIDAVLLKLGQVNP